MTRVVDRIVDSRIVAIIRSRSAQSAAQIGGALIEEGIDVVEVSLTTPDAVAVIRDLAAVKGACIGAGTILTQAHVEECREAGAEFLVSPHCSELVIAAAQEAELPMVAGVFTATDCAKALDSGADFLKLFPASVGGVALMKALSDPFPSVRWLPTGGVNLHNATEWWTAGATAVGVGGALTSGEMHTIRKNARTFRELAQSAPGGN